MQYKSIKFWELMKTKILKILFTLIFITLTKLSICMGYEFTDVNDVISFPMDINSKIKIYKLKKLISDEVSEIIEEDLVPEDIDIKIYKKGEVPYDNEDDFDPKIVKNFYLFFYFNHVPINYLIRGMFLGRLEKLIPQSNINKINKNGSTSLIYIIKLLNNMLNAEIDVKQTNFFRELKERLEKVKIFFVPALDLLFKSGANVAIKDNAGKDFFDYVNEIKDEKIKQEILEVVRKNIKIIEEELKKTFHYIKGIPEIVQGYLGLDRSELKESKNAKEEIAQQSQQSQESKINQKNVKEEPPINT